MEISSEIHSEVSPGILQVLSEIPPGCLSADPPEIGDFFRSKEFWKISDRVSGRIPE